MTLEEYSYIADIIGVIVVVATLIYLAVQVRQGTELLRSESRQAQLSNDQAGIYQFIEHPEVGKSFTRSETLSFEEKIQLQFWIIAQMRTREHEWLQYQSGALDEVTWLSYRNVIFFVLGSERSRALWDLCSPYFNVDFVEMVGKMIEEVPYVDFWEKLEAVS